MSTSTTPQVAPKAVSSSGVKKGIASMICEMKLEHPNLTHAAIAGHFGCSESNVQKVLAKFLGKYSEAELRTYQENRADVFDALGMRMIRSVTDAKLEKTPAVALVTGAAILYDKAQLERGKPTSINLTALLDVADMLRSKQ